MTYETEESAYTDEIECQCGHEIPIGTDAVVERGDWRDMEITIRRLNG